MVVPNRNPRIVSRDFYKKIINKKKSRFASRSHEVGNFCIINQDYHKTSLLRLGAPTTGRAGVAGGGARGAVGTPAKGGAG